MSQRAFVRRVAAGGGALTLAPVVAACSSGDKADPGPSTTRSDTLSPEFAAVADRARSLLPESGVPGAALGIFGNGREEHAVFGVADMESDAPVTPQTRFQTGSLTKTMTATAVMELVEQGRLDLDAPVRTYIPDLKLADESLAQAVTTRQLLTHTGGWWGEAFFDTGAGDDAVARYLNERLPTSPQLFPLERFFSYNSAGYVLLGRLLDVINGADYQRLIRERVLAPLEMNELTLVRSEVEGFLTPRATSSGRRASSSRSPCSSPAPSTPPAEPGRRPVTCCASPASTSVPARLAAASSCAARPGRDAKP